MGLRLWWSLAITAVAATTASTIPPPLWTVTGGAVTDLRRFSVDGRMTELTVLAGLQDSFAPPIQWIAVHNGVVYWTDAFPWPGLRVFDASTALPGQRRSTLLDDESGSMAFGAVAVGGSSFVYAVEKNSGSILEVNKNSTALAPEYRVLRDGMTNTTGLAVNSEGTKLFWLANGRIVFRQHYFRRRDASA